MILTQETLQLLVREIDEFICRSLEIHPRFARTRALHLADLLLTASKHEPLRDYVAMRTSELGRIARGEPL